MCATTLAPERIDTAELMLEPTLASAHDQWMAEVHSALLPVTLPDATFCERWTSIRYLAERLPARLRLERALFEQLCPFISDEDVGRLQVQSERLKVLYRDCERLSQMPGTAREYAAHTKELLKSLRLWCAEFERATRYVLEAVVSDEVIRLLGRVGLSCTPSWAIAVRC